MKKKLIFSVISVLLISFPVIVSANTNATYETSSENFEKELGDDFVQPENAALVGHILLGWLGGKGLDYAWENTNYDSAQHRHLCVSLPPEISDKDAEEAFGR